MICKTKKTKILMSQLWLRNIKQERETKRFIVSYEVKVKILRTIIARVT